MKRLLPAYPLFVKDPYFSIWSNTEELNASDTTSWTGKTSQMNGYVKTQNHTYCFMGLDSRAEKLEQTSLSVTAFSTDYEFKCSEFSLKVSFISPLLPTDLQLLSCPVCYMTYDILVNKDINAKIILALNENVAYENKSDIRGGVSQLQNTNTAWLGLKNQHPLSHAGDAIMADWGYYYVCGKNSIYTTTNKLNDFLYNNKEFEYEFDSASEHVACAYDNLEKGGSGKFLVAFDDTVSLYCFGEFLRGYFFRNGKTIFDAIDYSIINYSQIIKELNEFDTTLQNSSSQFDSAYTNILYASLRQSIAAHKLVEDGKGKILFISKECRSNGCSGTVDVSYPSMPLYLLYNPSLLKAMLEPIFNFAEMPVWEFDFAPHDVGVYPYCSGQVYGLKKENSEKHEYLYHEGNSTIFPLYVLPKGSDIYDFNMQMPVEESSDMLIMTTAYVVYSGDTEYPKSKIKLLTKWADYLVKSGLIPDNQLCTDDFAGHMQKNTNLSIKAIVALGAFAKLLDILGEAKSSKYYRDIAESFVKTFYNITKNTEVLPLSLDSKNDFSIKYNFAFDVLLKLNLFDSQILEREVDGYIARQNEYGVPLDTRKSYTKSDWIMWSTILTKDKQKQKRLFEPIANFLQNSPDRVPFADWYDTISGKHYSFTNRTVQGGCFILLLATKPTVL